MLYVNPIEANPAWRTDPAQIATQREAQALEEFERVFLYQMLREMRGTVPSGGIFEKSPAQKFFEESLDDALAGQMAQSGQLGIAQQIKEQWEQVRAMRETRANGLLEDAARGARLRPEQVGIRLERGAEALPIAPPSSSKVGLPIHNKTPLSFAGPASR